MINAIQRFLSAGTAAPPPPNAPESAALYAARKRLSIAQASLPKYVRTADRTRSALADSENAIAASESAARDAILLQQTAADRAGLEQATEAKVKSDALEAVAKPHRPKIPELRERAEAAAGKLSEAQAEVDRAIGAVLGAIAEAELDALEAQAAEFLARYERVRAFRALQFFGPAHPNGRYGGGFAVSGIVDRLRRLTRFPNPDDKADADVRTAPWAALGGKLAAGDANAVYEGP